MPLLKSVKTFATKFRIATRVASKALLGGALKFTSAAVEPIGFREVLLFGGVILLAVGLWPVYAPASFLLPGAILVYVSIFGTA